MATSTTHRQQNNRVRSRISIDLGPSELWSHLRNQRQKTLQVAGDPRRGRVTCQVIWLKIWDRKRTEFTDTYIWLPPAPSPPTSNTNRWFSGKMLGCQTHTLIPPPQIPRTPRISLNQMYKFFDIASWLNSMQMGVHWVDPIARNIQYVWIKHQSERAFYLHHISCLNHRHGFDWNWCEPFYRFGYEYISL